jgi:hypothetical protein
MRHKAITHPTCLKIGDRFYLISDRKKEVFQLLYFDVCYFKGIKKRLAIIKNDKDEEKRISANRVVVFLSHKITLPVNSVLF